MKARRYSTLASNANMDGRSTTERERPYGLELPFAFSRDDVPPA